MAFMKNTYNKLIKLSLLPFFLFISNCSNPTDSSVNNTITDSKSVQEGTPIKLTYNKDFIDILKSSTDKEIASINLVKIIDKSPDNIVTLDVKDSKGIDDIFTLKKLPDKPNAEVVINIKGLDKNNNIVAELSNTKKIEKIKAGELNFRIDKVTSSINLVQKKLTSTFEFEDVKTFVEKVYNYDYDADKLNKIYVDIDGVANSINQNKSIPQLSSSLINGIKTSAIVELKSDDNANLDDAIISLDSTNLKAEKLSDGNKYFVEGIPAESQVNITVLSKAAGTGAVKTILKRDFTTPIINISVSKE